MSQANADPFKRVLLESFSHSIRAAREEKAGLSFEAVLKEPLGEYLVRGQCCIRCAQAIS